MMQTKAPAPTTGSEHAAGTPAQRSVSSVPGMGANSGHARAEARTLQRLQKATSNTARVKQLGGMQTTAAPSQRREVAQQSITTPQGSGLPPHLKHGIENLSGISMDGVTVHYNSPQPAQLRAHAFAQGRNIHLGPGQETHLPHEAWHVVQQAQGRVAATAQMAGAALNDDADLEHEADVMGARAMAMPSVADGAGVLPAGKPALKRPVLQRKAGMEIELDVPFYGPSQTPVPTLFVNRKNQVLAPAENRQVENFLFGVIERNSKALSDDEAKLGYSLSSDHGEYQLVHRKLQAHIVSNYLGAEEKKALGDLTRFNMSNMEYATAAYSEDLPEHDVLMENAAKGVERHAIASTNAARSGKQENVPGVVDPFLYTGVPMAAFESLLENDAPGLKLLNDAHAKASNPVLAYQTTVGTMPSEIPDLFKQEAKELNEFKGTSTPGDPWADKRRERESRAKALILNESLDSATKAWATIPDEFKATFGGPHPEQALLGWMTLVAQYLIASLLDQTTYRYAETKLKSGDIVFRTGHSSTKNLVPYLSKVPLYLSQAALPPSVRPSLTSETGDAKKFEQWNNLFDALLEDCLARKDRLIAMAGVKPVTGMVLDRYNQSVAVARGVLYDDAKAWLRGVVVTGMTHNVISGRSLAVEEATDRETKAIHDGEKAIPLEDRATKYKMRFGNAAPANASAILMAEWRRAKARRAESIAKGNTKAKGKANEIKPGESKSDNDFFDSLPDAPDSPTPSRSLATTDSVPENDAATGEFDAPPIDDFELPSIPSGLLPGTDNEPASGPNEIKPGESELGYDFFESPPYWPDSPIPSVSLATTDSVPENDAATGEFDAPPIDDFEPPPIPD